tara:strand:+ start:379 stop:525 length:147 start_codon:yes stop_codon:yes gene_type:complete
MVENIQSMGVMQLELESGKKTLQHQQSVMRIGDIPIQVQITHQHQGVG